VAQVEQGPPAEPEGRQEAAPEPERAEAAAVAQAVSLAQAVAAAALRVQVVRRPVALRERRAMERLAGSEAEAVSPELAVTLAGAAQAFRAARAAHRAARARLDRLAPRAP
jgi:hypothetical protein